MRTVIRRRICAFLVLVMTLSVIVYLMPSRNADAASLINLSVKANNTEPGAGDVVTISVYADNFPEIVSFGPMKIHFDAALAEYVSVELGPEISSFIYNVTQDNNYVNISAIDQYFQDGESEHSAFDIDEQMILFTISFRVKQDASGQIPFWIEEPGDFISSDGKKVSTVVDNSISVTISNRISSEAALLSLSINEGTIEPPFDTDITEYEATVERTVTDLYVNATPSNLWAGIVINGNNNLQIGENFVTVIVTAQDGVTQKEYHIKVTRKESYVPDNAVLVDDKGVSYNFLDYPQNTDPPEGFTTGIKTINDFSVPAFVKDGFSSVLFYLYDGENPPGLYLYNEDLKTVIPYREDLTVMQGSKILFRANIPEDLELPKDFVNSERAINDILYTGYTDAEGRFVCYLADEAGEADFYSYDEVDHIFVRYVPVDRTAQKAYSALLTVFMITTAVEALFLVVIVIIVHRVLSQRKNPKPRRV